MADIGESAGDLHLATIVINVQDRGPEFMMLVDPAGRRLPVSLQLAGSPPEEPVRVHLDLYTSEQARHV